MNAVTLDALMRDRRVWRGRPAELPPSPAPSGWPRLDVALPAHGWPEAALSEILLSTEGIGELRLVLPLLARLTQEGQRIVLVAPPHRAHAPAWQAVGVALERVTVVVTPSAQVAWAMEQCLRSGACAAVLGWLERADDRTLRRLQIAAGAGSAIAFLFRPRGALANASPAALRVEVTPGQLQIRKCRGRVPSAAIPFAPPLT
ncbi:MAG TPA: translesion DNA synthesis-associated protein ImuA [Nevskiaceae bacterium]